MRGGPVLVGDASPEDLLARWAGGKDPSRVFVGEYEGAVVGVIAVAAPDAGGQQRRGRIDCCYVDEAARGVGVGTALMEAAVAWCAASGCTEVDALALPGDRSTKQRLEAAGFTARLLTLSRRLG
jgi:GNAT superfamily N-acetyltransferase